MKAAMFLLMSVTPLAAAAEVTPPQLPFGRADSFYEACRHYDNDKSCLTYVEGLSDGMWIAFIRAAIKNKGMDPSKNQPEFRRLAGYCPPENITIGTTFDVLMAHLKGNPADRTSTTAAAFAAAMINAFPCPAPLK